VVLMQSRLSSFFKNWVLTVYFSFVLIVYWEPAP
jgi:hypothetical protein